MDVLVLKGTSFDILGLIRVTFYNIHCTMPKIKVEPCLREIQNSVFAQAYVWIVYIKLPKFKLIIREHVPIKNIFFKSFFKITYEAPIELGETEVCIGKGVKKQI